MKLLPALTTLTALPVRASLALLALVAGGATAAAHPGHGLLEGGVLHAVTSPDHALLCGGLGVGVWLAGRLATGPRAARVLRSAGAALVAVAVLLLGIRA